MLICTHENKPECKFNGGVTTKIVLCTSMSVELSNSLISDWDNLTWTLGKVYKFTDISFLYYNNPNGKCFW